MIDCYIGKQAVTISVHDDIQDNFVEVQEFNGKPFWTPIDHVCYHDFGYSAHIPVIHCNSDTLSKLCDAICIFNGTVL